jgi:hypothetical protein
MKKIILAAIGFVMVVGFPTTLLASGGCGFGKFVQKCDDVDPGDDDHFE